MSGMMSFVSYGLGTLLAFALFAFIVIVFIQDIAQKKHTVLRNFPVVGHLRYFFEKQGEYFRQYFFMNDREELPFNRATRGWVYRLAKAEAGVIGFGSTNNTNEPGSILFVNHPYPVLEEDRLPTPPLAIGEGFCKEPFLAKSVVNVSGMSFAQCASILSATMAISRWGKDGTAARSSCVRRERKCISERELQVAYMDENRPTGSVARATSRATPRKAESRYAAASSPLAAV